MMQSVRDDNVAQSSASVYKEQSRLAFADAAVDEDVIGASLGRCLRVNWYCEKHARQHKRKARDRALCHRLRIASIMAGKTSPDGPSIYRSAIGVIVSSSGLMSIRNAPL